VNVQLYLWPVEHFKCGYQSSEGIEVGAVNSARVDDFYLAIAVARCARGSSFILRHIARVSYDDRLDPVTAAQRVAHELVRRNDARGPFQHHRLDALRYCLQPRKLVSVIVEDVSVEGNTQATAGDEGGRQVQQADQSVDDK